MNATPTTFDTTPRPLAVAWLLGGALLIGLTACNRNKTASEDTNPAAAATVPSPASTAMPPPATTTGPAGAASAMGDETPGNMSGASQPTTTAEATAEPMTSGPITDTQFYSQAMTGDQTEIATGKMVASTSSDADVQKLANKIVNDHEALDKKLKDAAGAATAAAGTVDPNVQGKTGKDLDMAYADAMVADHQKDIPMFENAAKNASSAKARKLASDALPVLRDHLKRAQTLQTKLASG